MNVVKLGSRSKVYLKSLIRDLDLELVVSRRFGRREDKIGGIRRRWEEVGVR